MAEKAALITGGSGGIGLALARRLAVEGYAITISGRRAEKLAATTEALADDGFEVTSRPADVTVEEEVVALVEHHREKWGRMDVLVNNAGVGIGQPLNEITVKYVDMQSAVNLKAAVVATRESLDLLRAAGQEHGKALILNVASIAGKAGQPWLSIYSATKAALISFTQATQKELTDTGIQATAFAPAFVDTDMTEFVKEHVGQERMIKTSDIAEGLSFLLKTSPNCQIPEIVFNRAGSGPDAGAP